MSNLLKIDKRFIGNDQVDGDKILLLNGQTLRGLDALSNEIDLLEKVLNDSKSYTDQELADIQTQIDYIVSNVDPSAIDSLVEVVQAFQQADNDLNNAITALAQSASSGLAQEVLDREAGDAATLASANSYTDAQIAAIPAVDLSNYETIANVDSKDAATLSSAQAYTDAQIALIPEVDLSNYETIANVDSKDASTLASAQAYTDSEVAAEALARETVDNLIRSEIDDANAAREAGDVQALQDAKDYTDEQIALIPEVDLSAVEADIAALQAADTVLDGKIDAEKARIDAILLASDADKDSFAEIVNLINSVDTENDQAFASYVLSNDAALAQEVSDREAGDADLQAQIDDLEVVANAKEVVEVDNLAALEALASPSVEVIYVTKDENKIYRFEAPDLFIELSATDLSPLDARLTTIEGDLAIEVSNRVAADSALQSQIGQEITDRQNADNLIKEYKPEQVIYVSKNGDDANSGSEQLPFLTLGAALASITDASPTKRYAVRVSSGTYVEANIALKANVFIVGENAKEAVRIDSTISMDSSFSGSGDHRSGFANVLILKAANFDWSSVTSAAGKLYFSQTVFGSTINMYGHNNAIAQAQFADCQVFGKLTISGINVAVFHNNFCWAGIDLNQHPNGGMATILNAVGGTIGGELKLTTTVDDFNRRCSAFVKSCYTSQITIDGIKSYVDATNDSIPAAGATILNSGNLIRLNDAGLSRDLSNLTYPTAVNQPIMPANTNATNLGDWGKQWFFNFAYVHGSSGTDLYVISTMAAYDAAGDDSGKSIFIEADGYGLKENVDGGNISLKTSNVSGTGVRGKIQLDGREVDVTSKQIKNLADGSDATDAVNKGQLDGALSSAQAYTDAQIAAIPPVEFIFEEDIRFDISSELNFIELPHLAKAVFKVSVNRLNAFKGTDYTVSEVGGVTRITWAGDFVQPDGELALKAGDVVHVTYAR